MEEKQFYFLKYYIFTLVIDEKPCQYSSTITISNVIINQSPPDCFLYRCSGEGKIFDISSSGTKYAERLSSVRCICILQ